MKFYVNFSGSREASFVHAITAAGVMYEVTRACSRGDIGACSCDLHKRGEGRDGKGNSEFLYNTWNPLFSSLNTRRILILIYAIVYWAWTQILKEKELSMCILILRLILFIL